MYDYKNGTSQAAPVVSAVYAWLSGVLPEESSKQIYARLLLSANSPEGHKGLAGLLHADKAYALDSSAIGIIPRVK